MIIYDVGQSVVHYCWYIVELGNFLADGRGDRIEYKAYAYMKLSK
jgi:hypothetical protein